MTRKHFVLIARILHKEYALALRTYGESSSEARVLRESAAALAAGLKTVNDSFDRRRFLDAVFYGQGI